MNADEYIKILELKKHPEGGYYREVYRSSKSIYLSEPEPGFKGERNFSTSIYFLLKDDEVSTFHKIKSDEIWHHYTGSAVRVMMLNANGEVVEKIVGKNINDGESFQLVIPANTWFCAEVIDKNFFALVGCTVSPGFDFKDFEIGKREELVMQFPQHRDLISRFTKS